MTSLARKLRWSAFTAWHARGEKAFAFRPLEEILGIQRRRVRAMIQHAWDRVPFYQRAMKERGLLPRDIASAEDLARLPLIDSTVLADHPDLFRPSGMQPGLRLESSGTSGRSKYIEYDPAALFLSMANGQRHRAVIGHFIGRGYGYREMLLGRAGGTPHVIRRFYEAHSWMPRGVELRRKYVPIDAPVEEQIAALNDFRPLVLIGYGSHLGGLLRRATAGGRDAWRPKVIVYGADGMDDSDRSWIEGEFGVPVISVYQAVEALRIAFQCEHRQGLHLSLDCVAVRAIRDDGETAGPGETGHIVISNLTNRATVLLNYKLGDVVTIGRGACPCGRSLPVIERIQGRSSDLIVLADGRLVHAVALIALRHASPDVIQLQVIQRDLDRFHLRAVLRAGAPSDEAGRRLVEAFRSKVHATAEVGVEWCEVIPPGANGKVKAVISEVKP